eukprot:12811147-Alexandrium_andersonii.AAC.1
MGAHASVRQGCWVGTEFGKPPYAIGPSLTARPGDTGIHNLTGCVRKPGLHMRRGSSHTCFW